MNLPDREIRIFVSSTFRDMQRERELLAKQVFPELRRICAERLVTFTEVDLRWGITEEEASRGQVLPICLEEINLARPHFIGLLAERYGWIPDAVEPAVLEQEPWLREQVERRKSVTELEILHGVLNEPGMAGQACFYFRDPAYVLSKEVAETERGDFVAEDAESAEKLAQLKETIRRSGMPLVENYSDPAAAAVRVREHLLALIDQRFPPAASPNPLELEAAAHSAIAANHARLHIARTAELDRLSAWVDAGGPPLVVLGESGIGKSALLAKWWTDFRAKHPNDFCLIHFIGATPAGADAIGILRRILGEFNRRLGLAISIPDKPSDVAVAFSEVLDVVAAKTRVVLVLDALNQVDDREQSAELSWLPAVLPANVRLLVSTLPGLAHAELSRRGWPTLAVGLLNVAERENLATLYLRQYRKQLSREHVQRIAQSSPTANPLYLRAMLEELRLWGDHSTLDQTIRHLLGAETIPDLFDRILVRYEADYGHDRPGLVGNAFSFLWGARKGLSEAELLALLGENDEPLPRAYWSPLSLGAGGAFLVRSGMIGFAHDYFRLAVERRYLSSPQLKADRHAALAEHFERAGSRRKIEELPWQLAQSGQWGRAVATLADPKFFREAWDYDTWDLKRIWALIESQSEFRIADAYRPLLAAPLGPITMDVAQLFLDTDHPEEAVHFGRHLLRESEVRSLYTLRDMALGMLARALFECGRLDEAMPVVEELERGTPGSFMLNVEALALNAKAAILAKRGEHDAALELLGRVEQLCRRDTRMGDNAKVLATALGNRGAILVLRHQLEDALVCLREQEDLCRRVGDKEALVQSLMNRAAVHRRTNDATAALGLLDEAAAIARDLGMRQAVVHSSGLRASVLRDLGRQDDALWCHHEHEALARQLGDPGEVGEALTGQAAALVALGRPSDAFERLVVLEAMFRESGDDAGLQCALGNQARVLKQLGDRAGEIVRLREQETICSKLRNQSALAVCTTAQARCLEWNRDLASAVDCHRRAMEMYRDLGDEAGVAESLGGQALDLLAMNETAAAVVLFREQEALLRRLEKPGELQSCLGNLAMGLVQLGEGPAALVLLSEKESICRELDDELGLANALGKQAMILWSVDPESDRVVPLLEQSETIGRSIGERKDLQAFLELHATVLLQKGKVGAALRLLVEQVELLQVLGKPGKLVERLRVLAQLLEQVGQLTPAAICRAEEAKVSLARGDGRGCCVALGYQAALQARLGRSGDARQTVDQARKHATSFHDKDLLDQLAQVAAFIDAEESNQGRGEQ